MAAVMIKIETAAGAAKVARILSALEPRTLLDLIGGRFLSYVDESFKKDGRGEWKPLSPLTLLLRKSGGNRPLQDTGKYKQSFESARTDGQTYVEVGSNRKTPSGILLAAIHEHGAVVEPRPGTFWQYSYTTTSKRGPRTISVTRPAMLVLGKIGKRLIFANRVVIPARPVLPTKAVAERLVRETVDEVFARIEKQGA